MPEVFENQLIVMTVFMMVWMLLMTFILTRMYMRPKPGHAIIRTGFGGTRETFNGIVVTPMHAASQLDITMRTIEITLDGAEAPRTADGKRVYLSAVFSYRVNPTAQDVLRAFEAFGEQYNDAQAMEAMFRPKFHHALYAIAQKVDGKLPAIPPDLFVVDVIKQVGHDLSGCKLADCVISRISIE